METLFIGQNAIFLPQAESTNSYAIELLKNVNLPEGTIVYTTNQTHGRGQRGNSWDTEPGLNLAISYILKPSFLNANKLFFLYIISALAVYDLMSELLGSSQYDIKIKWPNDILVNSKKIAGILNENSISNNQLQSCVCGIGLNINQTNFNETINAVSVKLISGHEHDLLKVIKLLNYHFEHYYLKLKSENYKWLREQYDSHFYKLNQIVNFSIHGIHKPFLVKGINEQGLLSLQDDSGINHDFDIKQIKWL